MKVAIWVVTFGNDDLLVPADRRGTRDGHGKCYGANQADNDLLT